MSKFLSFLGCGILFSFYMFPFTFTFLPIGNTKIYLAVCGLILFIYNGVNSYFHHISKRLAVISLLGFCVSFVSVLTLYYNDATDITYVRYVIMMWVWLGAAYFVIYSIKFVHGSVSIELVASYFIAVCVGQCILALVNEFSPLFKTIVDRFVEQDTENLNRIERMYGIGASLDTAGSRFACALIMLIYLILKRVRLHCSYKELYIYIIAFVFISVAGNMVARTTSAGLIIAFLYYLYVMKSIRFVYHIRVFTVLFIVILFCVPMLVTLYSTVPEIHKMLRFAFEMLFNYFEKGSFESSSTDELQAMWTYLPESLKTWIIGDGYFLSPYASNPYYLADHKWAYYMGTDVGYLRFIYYFGIIGLSVFICFFVYCTKTCADKFSNDRILFVLLFLMNMVLWAKVATDLFLVYALFLFADDKSYSKEIDKITR